MRLLPRHGDAELLLVREEVVLVVETDVDLHEADLAVEAVGRLAIFRHRGAGLLADVRGFVERKGSRRGRVNAAPLLQEWLPLG